MTLYVQFVACLAVGLVGTGMVLTILLEKLFHDWDVFAELGDVLTNGWRHKRALLQDRAEDVLMERERRQAAPVSSTRLDERRQQLAELASVEQRLRGPKTSAIVLTPLPPPRAAGEVETAPAAHQQIL